MTGEAGLNPAKIRSTPGAHSTRSGAVTTATLATQFADHNGGIVRLASCEGRLQDVARSGRASRLAVTGAR